MDLVSVVVGFLAGVAVGAGGIVFYMRWKMGKQLDAMQENMEGMFEATEDLMELEEEEKEEK
jgi:hypothetical protein